jgi:hypothetical protein
MSGERVGFRFKHADAVVKRNPQGRSLSRQRMR